MKKAIILLLYLLLLSFTTTDIRSIYNIPVEASGVFATDYDLDGDLDIVTNHGIGSETHWGGIYIQENDGYGHFSFMDSIYDSVGWVNYADTVFSKTYPDILYNFHDSITVLLSNDGENYTRTRFYVGPKVNDFVLGDVDDNGYLDVEFISNNNHYWGIIYNLGGSEFTAPEYYYMETAPTDIACGDLNADNSKDIVITGASSKIYISAETGFEMQLLQHGASHVSIADMDDDGDNDLVLVGDAYITSFVHVYENFGNDVFDTVNDFNVPEGCPDFLITDFNNDDLPDALFLTYGLNDIGCIVYYNQGNFQMGDPHNIDLINYGEARRFMSCADIDGNGYNDIIITRQVFDTAYAPSLLEILFNDGHGNFGEDPLTSIQSSNFELQASNLNCYPNPFKSQANIEYIIDKECLTQLDIYDLYGQEIKLLKNRILTKGKYKITWDGKDNSGKEVSSGIYIIRLATGRQTHSCRLMYMK